ncbi:MAG: hypothetical protein N3D83_11675 [Pyrobaculum aerophilum]|nr:hypothetical protein [Pyrobaculum aerophilum]MCX8137676.1 hypothetical protein [Pyrobaculum aerophilum]
MASRVVMEKASPPDGSINALALHNASSLVLSSALKRTFTKYPLCGYL